MPHFHRFRLSLTRWYCVKTARHIVKILPLMDSSISLVFACTTDRCDETRRPQ